MIISISRVLEKKIYGVRARTVQRPALSAEKCSVSGYLGINGDKRGLSICDFFFK